MRASLPLVASLVFAGCVASPHATDPRGEDIAHAGSPAYVGEKFQRGFVLLSFVASGPDNEVRVDFQGKLYATMLYAGTVDAGDGSSSVAGFATLHGRNNWTAAARGDALGAVELVAATGPGRAPGGGALGLKVLEIGWNQTWWVGFGAGSDTGPATMALSVEGADIRLLSGPLEGDARLYTQGSFAGAVDARVGDGDVGAAATALRHLPFETSNGTVVSAVLGGLSAVRADDVTLSAGGQTFRWSGAHQYPTGLDARAPGADGSHAGRFAVTTDAAAWTLAVERSARVSAHHDYVLVADVSWPSEAQVLV